MSAFCAEMSKTLSRGPVGPTVDLLRVDSENDEELAAWLDSMKPEQRTRMLLSSVRGVSQGGNRSREPLALTTPRIFREAEDGTLGYSTQQNTPRARRRLLETVHERRRPATEDSRLHQKLLFDVETEKKKLAALQVSSRIRRIPFLHPCDRRNLCYRSNQGQPFLPALTFIRAGPQSAFGVSFAGEGF